MQVGSAALGLLLSLVSCASEAHPIIERTKTTKATYAAYAWVVSRTVSNERDDGWSAEFHSGDWHRSEGVHSRVIANCRTHDGWFYDVAGGKVVDAPNAWVGACGIYSPPDIKTVEQLAPVISRYGELDAIKVSDPKFVRFYTITKSGVIVRSDWVSASGSAFPCIQLEPVEIVDTLPKADMFTPESLEHSVVPDRYKAQPQIQARSGLSGQSCGA